MRKILAMICVLVMLSTVLSGCKPTPDLTVFNSWITENGFKPGMDQKSMLHKISSYTHLGKNLTPDRQFHEKQREGYSVGSSFWALNINSKTGNGTVQTNIQFYVRENLDNLQYPGNVKIGDSRENCLDKLGLAGKKSKADDITIGNKTCEISVSDTLCVYTENYDWKNKSNETVQVTRSVMLKFSADVLNEVSITISEKYPE